MAGGLSINVATGGLIGGSSKVVMDPAGLAACLRGPSGPVYRWAIRAGDLVKERAKVYVGVDTGNLRDHIVKRVTTEGSGIVVYVVADTPYSLYHHEGSRAVEGKLMVFRVGDAVIFGPGLRGGTTLGKLKTGSVVFTMRRRAIPPNRFLIRALNDLRATIVPV